MKKILSLVLVLSVLMGIFATVAYAADYAMCSTPTRDGTVYVRSEAGVTMPILGVANNGDTLLVLQKGNTWHKVRVIRTGIEGWMYGGYITFLGVSNNSNSGNNNSGSNSGASSSSFGTLTGSAYKADPSVKDTDTVINKYGTISSSDGYANLRWGPSTSYASMGKVYNSTTVTVLEQVDNWYRCFTNGKIGYINKNLVKLKEGSVSNPSGLNGIIRSSDGYAAVRQGPGTMYTILYTLNVGNTITTYTSSSDWLKITNSWSDAYIYRTLVRYYSAAYTTGNVNLRMGPTKNYDIIRALPTGTRVSLLATDGNFCKVDTGKEIAYLSCKYLNY